VNFLSPPPVITCGPTLCNAVACLMTSGISVPMFVLTGGLQICESLEGVLQVS
jgi:hypothetical protein